MTNVRKPTIHSRAHKWASAQKLKAPKEWPVDSLGAYWWGLFEGFSAGIKAERRKR